MADLDDGTLFRALDHAENRVVYALCDGDEVVAIPGTIEQLHTRHRAEATLPAGKHLGGVDDVEPLAAATPSKIVCVGLNYRRHADEMNKTAPDEPLLFLKPPSAVVGPGEAIELPEQSDEVHHEGELAVVIGRRIRDVDPATAQDAIFGYTCGLDITARDIQRRENRYTRSKGFDTFAPIGPAIALAGDFDPSDHRLVCRVDDQTRQESPLDDFIFDVDEVLSFISTVMTLEPGDVVFTGTPSGVGPLHDGERVSVEIDGIGRLENPVRPRR